MKSIAFKILHNINYGAINRNKFNNNTLNNNNMTNLENKIANLKEKKEGLSFLTSVEDILKKEYSEIWDDLDSSYIRGMLNEKENLMIFDKTNNLTNLRYVSDIIKDKNDKYIVYSEINWRNLETELKDIFVITDTEKYLIYLYEKEEKESLSRVDAMKKQIEEDNESIAARKEYYDDAIRFGLTSLNISKINSLRLAEKIKDGTATTEEIANRLY